MATRTTRSSRKPGARLGAARFLEAVRHWDAAVVAEAVRAHPELAVVTDRHGRSALHVCAASPLDKSRRPASAAVATAKVLLRAGAGLDAIQQIPDGGEAFPASPLWHAIARGKNRGLARFLLREGANPDYCLWAVVWNDDVVTARLLHAHGANVNLTFHGETPLLYATRLRRTRMMRWLLRNGANPDIADADGKTPLAHAVKRRYSLAEVEELLRHGADAGARARDGSTPRSLVGVDRKTKLSQLLDRYADETNRTVQVA